MNICAVRSIASWQTVSFSVTLNGIASNESAKVVTPGLWLPHEPTIVTEESRAKALAMCFFPETVLPVGTEIRQSALHWCRHCGGCYGEG